MKYVLLLHLPDTPPTVRDSEATAEMEAYAALKADLIAEGVWLGGQALQPVAMTTQVKVRDSETLIVDAPLAETAEQIAGYYLVECRDLDEAIAIAARIPGASHGTIEVRPVFDYEATLTHDG